MSLAIAFLSLALMASLAEPRNTVVNPQPLLNTFVTCQVPLELPNGIQMPIPIPREPPIIPLQQVDSTQWLPTPSGWDAPFGKLSQSSALIHLGNDYDPILTRTDFQGGSDINLIDIPGYQVPELVVPGVVDPADEAVVLRYLEDNGYADFSCELIPRYEDLGINYFPRFVLLTSCAPGNCSFALGSNCLPDLSTGLDTSPYLVTMLRWDCCQNYVGGDVNSGYAYECGWIKVRIPIIRRCFCGCSSAAHLYGK